MKMLITSSTITTPLFFLLATTTLIHPISTNKNCEELPQKVLESILGSAFNPRYMSVSHPPESLNSKKRTANTADAFSVGEDFVEEVDTDQPAWSVSSHVEIAEGRRQKRRRKRRDAGYNKSVDYSQQWRCNSTLVWTDLGADYFPRYLRSVQCQVGADCWFNMFECRPRAFTVKILRRKRGLCVGEGPVMGRMGSAGLPNELKELWVWEERAVNFCCECALKTTRSNNNNNNNNKSAAIKRII